MTRWGDAKDGWSAMTEWELVSFAPVGPGWMLEYDDGQTEPLAGYLMARVEGELRCFPAGVRVATGHDWEWLVEPVRRPEITRIYPADDQRRAPERGDIVLLALREAGPWRYGGHPGDICRWCPSMLGEPHEDGCLWLRILVATEVPTPTWEGP